MDMHALHALIPPALMLLLTLCMAAVVVSDAAKYIIPNSLNLVILLAYGVAVFFLPLHPLGALAAAGCLLAVGLGMFALGLMGGGDVKLLAVLALWTGWGAATINFIMLTAVAGGVLVVVVLIARWLIPPFLFKLNPTKPFPRLLTRKQPVPYGLAIAAAFLILLWGGGVPGLDYLR